MIMHNWPDAECATILRRARAIAGPATRLVIVDSVLTRACTESADGCGRTHGEAPQPLLANWGTASALSYKLDMIVSLHPFFVVACGRADRQRTGRCRCFATTMRVNARSTRFRSFLRSAGGSSRRCIPRAKAGCLRSLRFRYRMLKDVAGQGCDTHSDASRAVGF